MPVLAPCTGCQYVLEMILRSYRWLLRLFMASLHAIIIWPLSCIEAWDPRAEVFYLFPRFGWKLEATRHSQSEPWSYERAAQGNQVSRISDLFEISSLNINILKLFLILFNFYWLLIFHGDTVTGFIYLIYVFFCVLLYVFTTSFYVQFLFLWSTLLSRYACFEVAALCEVIYNVGLEICSINKDYNKTSNV